MKLKDKEKEELDTKEEVIENDNNIEKLLEEKDLIISDLQNKLLMKEADLINFKRRKEEETSNILKYASCDLIIEILKTVDNLERAISSINEDSNILTGIKMVYDGLISTLESFGVKEIDSLGLTFDHNVHNAVMTDNDKEVEDDIITEVLQKGYLYKERVIRPAMVKVNKK